MIKTHTTSYRFQEMIKYAVAADYGIHEALIKTT